MLVLFKITLGISFSVISFFLGNPAHAQNSEIMDRYHELKASYIELKAAQKIDCEKTDQIKILLEERKRSSKENKSQCISDLKSRKKAGEFEGWPRRKIKKLLAECMESTEVSNTQDLLIQSQKECIASGKRTLEAIKDVQKVQEIILKEIDKKEFLKNTKSLIYENFSKDLGIVADNIHLVSSNSNIVNLAYIYAFEEKNMKLLKAVMKAGGNPLERCIKKLREDKAIKCYIRMPQTINFNSTNVFPEGVDYFVKNYGREKFLSEYAEYDIEYSKYVSRTRDTGKYTDEYWVEQNKCYVRAIESMGKAEKYRDFIKNYATDTIEKYEKKEFLRREKQSKEEALRSYNYISEGIYKNKTYNDVILDGISSFILKDRTDGFFALEYEAREEIRRRCNKD